MDKIVIELEIKNVYGDFLFYPKNDVASLLCRITGQKTLTLNQVKEIAKFNCFEPKSISLDIHDLLK